jgi:hypothetical protein
MRRTTVAAAALLGLTQNVFAGTPSYLDPYRLPISLSEVKEDPGAFERGREEGGDAEVHEEEEFLEGDQTRFAFFGYRASYVYTWFTGDRVSSPSHQMGILLEGGKRYVSEGSGWDLAARFSSHVFGGQWSLGPGAGLNWDTPTGRWGLWGLAQYRSSFEDRGGFWAPVIGFGFDWWAGVFKYALSQYMISTKIEIAFFNGEAVWMFGIGLGQDFQW